MTEKSRVNKEAFGWVDEVVDQEQTAEQPIPTQKKQASSRKAVKTESVSAKAKSDVVTNNNHQRLIVIVYQNATGDIMASQELMFDSEGNGNIAWSGITMDMTVKIFKLMGELADKETTQIQFNYKVNAAGTLELKQW